MKPTTFLERFVQSINVRADVYPSSFDSQFSEKAECLTPSVTDRRALLQLYRTVPGPFPPAFEELVLSYRWPEVEVEGMFRLFSNPPGNDFTGLAEEMTADRIFVEVLFPNGLIPFGRASESCYDPICFGLNHRNRAGDCPIIRVEHEAVLCHLKVKETWTIAKTFAELMNAVIKSSTND